KTHQTKFAQCSAVPLASQKARSIVNRRKNAGQWRRCFAAVERGWLSYDWPPTTSAWRIKPPRLIFKTRIAASELFPIRWLQLLLKKQTFDVQSGTSAWNKKRTPAVEQTTTVLGFHK